MNKKTESCLSHSQKPKKEEVFTEMTNVCRTVHKTVSGTANLKALKLTPRPPLLAFTPLLWEHTHTFVFLVHATFGRGVRTAAPT